MACNMRLGLNWVPAVVIERLGPLTYLIKTTDYLLWKIHIDLLCKLRVNSQAETPRSTESDPSDLDIPLGDTTSLGTPPKKSILHLSPLVRTGTKILSLRPPDTRDIIVKLQISIAGMFNLVGRNVVY